MSYMVDPADRVGRGAKLLDKIQPDWHRMIALDELAMNECTKCILGQVYGNYCTAVNDLQSSNMLQGIGDDFGFNIADFETVNFAIANKAFDALADLWRAEIRARLAAAGEATS